MLLWTLISLILVFFSYKWLKKPKIPDGLKTIPMAEGCLPLLGHAYKISPAKLPKLIEDCYKKHGKIFKFKVFNKTWVVLCGKEFFPAFYSASEEGLSFLTVGHRFYVFPALNWSGCEAEQWLSAFRQSVSTSVFKRRCPEDKELCEKVAAEAFRMVETLKEAKTDLGVNLTKFAMGFICSAISPLLFGVNVSEETGTTVLNFSNSLDQAVELAACFPHFVVRLLFQRKLDYQLSEISKEFTKHVKKCRADRSKQLAPFLKFFLEYIDPRTKRKLTDKEIANILSGVLCLNSGNTANAIILTLLNILKNSDVLHQLKEEVRPLVLGNNWEGLLDLPYLHGCVMETARLAAKPVLSLRTPVNMKSIGGYYIGDTDFVGVGANLLQTNLQLCKDSFPQEDKFSPERYTDKKGYHVLTWSAGKHICPGRILAQKIIKIAVAILITNIDFEEGKTVIKEKRSFSNSAFSEIDHKFFIRSS